jgi:hypothetical protein
MHLLKSLVSKAHGTSRQYLFFPKLAIFYHLLAFLSPPITILGKQVIMTSQIICLLRINNFADRKKVSHLLNPYNSASEPLPIL